MCAAPDEVPGCESSLLGARTGWIFCRVIVHCFSFFAVCSVSLLPAPSPSSAVLFGAVACKNRAEDSRPNRTAVVSSLYNEPHCCCYCLWHPVFPFRFIGSALEGVCAFCLFFLWCCCKLTQLRTARITVVRKKLTEWCSCRGPSWVYCCKNVKGLRSFQYFRACLFFAVAFFIPLLSPGVGDAQKRVSVF
jgi:hypothetical protein